MAPAHDTAPSATRRTRKSTTGFSPSKAADKENAAMDADSNGLASTAAASRKKLRSKSMGPGGIDALKSTSGNRRVSLAAPSRPPPRSILKPTLPVLPDIPPLKSRGKGKASPTRGGGANDDGNATKVALRTEEEQQAAAREREREERERAAREKEVHDHREARRKSLANRRVSFAAEATLHTFHDIDYLQDLTTSTEATTARRASSVVARSPAPPSLPPIFADANTDADADTDASEPPSTPLRQIEDADAVESPADQREMHQQKRRRSSAGASVLGFGDPNSAVDDNTMTSTIYDSDGGDGVEEDDAEEELDGVSSDSGDSDSDEGDGATMVTVDADEMTSASVMSSMSAVSMRSVSPDASTADVDEALRLATQRAGAQATETRRQRPLDEDEELIPAFVGWGKKASGTNAPVLQPQDQRVALSPQGAQDEDTAMSMDMDVDMDLDGGMDMETTRPMGGIIHTTENSPDDDMSMDVTRAYGGIVLPPPTAEVDSVASSPMIMPDDTIAGDEPMELTTVLGAIRRGSEVDEAASVDENGLEDMSMELTTVLGGVLGRSSFGAHKARRLSRRQTMQSPDDEDDEAAMDMTIAMGKIVTTTSLSKDHGADPADPAGDEDEEMDMTMGMEMTTALGGIFKPASPTRTRTVAPAPANVSEEPPVAAVAARPEKLAKDAQTPTKDGRRQSSSPPKTARRATSELSAFSGRGLRRTPARSTSASPNRQPEPATKPQAKAPAPSTPQRASPARFIGSRSKSPARKARAASVEKSTTPKSPPKHFSQSLFTQNPTTGVSGPSVVLTPQGPARPSAFVGAGPASPRITEIFSRRSSLVDAAAEFVPGSAQKDRPAVSFDEPSRQSSPSDEPSVPNAQDDREMTQSLKDLIDNLSPKKNPLRGRKSLHVGSARGILGKRPLELDGDEDDNDDDDAAEDAELESQNLVKRFKGAEPSPVKNIRLQQPPSMMETIGRSSRSRHSPPAMPLPSAAAPAPASPRRPAGLAVAAASVDANDVVRQGTGDEDDNVGDADGFDKIHLSEFLNLANIHFMELETTKRRATEGPGAFDKHGPGGRPSTDEDGRPKDAAVESLVTTVCKVPLLDMYQHACRELKNYIEEGRSIMREIETETYEDNPPIFREYTTATPEMRAQMDNQFKNIKIFARLQSKKQWYEWRTKLHQGLQEGMAKTLRDLERDRDVLHERRAQVDAAYPALRSEYEALERERVQLESFAAQLGGDDQEALIAARVKKGQLTGRIAAHESETARLEADMTASKARVAAMKTEREQYLRELDEAKRIQEERRSWSHQEISSLKTQVDALEKKSGWAVTGAQGTTLSLAYRREIELVFDVAAFRPGRRNAQIDLWYIGHTRDRDPQPCTRETEFFLECIRDHVRALRQADTHPSRLLKVVRASWDTAKQALSQIRHLGLTFPTATTKTSDTSLDVATSVLLVPLRTKIEVVLRLRSVESATVAAAVAAGAGAAATTPRGLRLAVTAEARVVYGEPFNAAKMSEFLAAHIGRRVVAPSAAAAKTNRAARTADAWVDTVEELKGKLLARGRKR